MKHNDIQSGSPEIIYKDTKTNVEAIAAPVEGMKAYATDTHLEGVYNGTAWEWIGASTVALLNQANSFTLINPLTTIAESWIGPAATTGIYFQSNNVSIGQGYASAVVKLGVTGSFDGTATQYGCLINAISTPAADSSFDVYAMAFSGRKYGSKNINSVYGITGLAIHQGTAGVINQAVGGIFALGLYGNSGDTGTILSGRAIQIASPYRVSGNLATITNNYGILIDNQGNAFITNSYGLYIATQSGSGAKNYAIYTNTGLIYFGDRVGIGVTNPNANAILDITSTTKAFMPPRMTTTQIAAIPSPTEGMECYDLTLHKMSYYNGTIWAVV